MRKYGPTWKSRLQDESPDEYAQRLADHANGLPNTYERERIPVIDAHSVYPSAKNCLLCRLFWPVHEYIHSVPWWVYIVVAACLLAISHFGF